MYGVRKSEEYRAMEVDKTFKTCRLCLSGNEGLIHVFETGSFGYAPAEFMADLLRLEVSAEDRYPQYVCGVCLGKLREFKKFKKQCETCKELLDRAYDAQSKSLTDITPNEVTEPDSRPPSTTTGEDSQIPNDEQMGSFQEEETDSFDNHTVSKPSVPELNIALTRVKDEPHDDGSNNEMESYVSPLCAMTTGDDSQVPNEEQMVLCREEEVDPLGDINVITPNASELEDPLSEVKDEPHDDGSNNEDPGTSKDVLDSIKGEGEEEKRKLLWCSHCKEAYSCPMAYCHHLEEHGRNTLKCSLCDTLFANKKSLLAHVKRHFEEEKEHHVTCHLCGRAYTNTIDLKLHLFLHGDRNYECNVCGRAFVKSGCLREHRKAHTKADDRVCKICGRIFDGRAELREHLNGHKIHGNVKKKYACSVCDQKCITPSQLVIHMRRHTKEKPFACPTCGKCFSVKYKLDQHIKAKHTQ